MSPKPKTTALMEIKKETADIVLSKVQHFQRHGELDLPPNYSAANALKSAWLILQETLDKDKRPALEVCGKASIANALLDMVIQGLNPAKKQCYFIVYGNHLALQRSYFGTKAVALRVAKDLQDIFSEVVYKGDNLTYRIDKGRRIIEEHTQSLSSINNANIVAAYAVAVDKEGEVVRSELMTFEQIKQAWKQSRMNPVADNGNIKAGSTHGKFTDEMAKKTVTSRLAKHFINSSSDADLIIASVKRTDDQVAEVEAEAEVEEFANSEVIDIERTNGDPEPGPGEMSDEEKAEIMAQEAADAEQSGGPGF